MSYESYYDGGWRSGEAGDTSISPEALNHMEDGIRAANERRIEAGTVNVAGKASEAVEKRVNFSKPFDGRPSVVVSANTASPHLVFASPYAVDADGFAVVLYRHNNAETTIEWEAVGR